MAKKKVWYDYGNEIYHKYKAVMLDKLENCVYRLCIDEYKQFFLVKEVDEYTFPYKLYSLESKFIDRVIKSYSVTTGNMGVLLNGLRGTGKTITAKIICNTIKQPVIIINSKIDGANVFVNSIPQDITVFLDEYEKIFDKSTEMLTIMDGSLNSDYRRLFLLTTNNLNVDENLIQRPSRIRYLKKFEDLNVDVIEEIVDDLLINKDFKKDCIKFISSLQMITVDVVKAVLNEVNIHNESPNEFGDVFNVKKLNGKFNLSIQLANGTFVPFMKNVVLDERPPYDEKGIGWWFEVDNIYLAKISKVINRNTIELTPNKDKNSCKILSKPTIIVVSEAEETHYSYAYGYGNATKFGIGLEEPTMGLVQENEIEAILKRLEEEKLGIDEDDDDDELTEASPK